MQGIKMISFVIKTFNQYKYASRLELVIQKFPKISKLTHGGPDVTKI